MERIFELIPFIEYIYSLIHKIKENYIIFLMLSFIQRIAKNFRRSNGSNNGSNDSNNGSIKDSNNGFNNGSIYGFNYGSNNPNQKKLSSSDEERFFTTPSKSTSLNIEIKMESYELGSHKILDSFYDDPQHSPKMNERPNYGNLICIDEMKNDKYNSIYNYDNFDQHAKNDKDEYTTIYESFFDNKTYNLYPNHPFQTCYTTHQNNNYSNHSIKLEELQNDSKTKDFNLNWMCTSNSFTSIAQNQNLTSSLNHIDTVNANSSNYSDLPNYTNHSNRSNVNDSAEHHSMIQIESIKDSMSNSNNSSNEINSNVNDDINGNECANSKSNSSDTVNHQIILAKELNEIKKMNEMKEKEMNPLKFKDPKSFHPMIYSLYNEYPNHKTSNDSLKIERCFLFDSISHLNLLYASLSKNEYENMFTIDFSSIHEEYKNIFQAPSRSI